MVAQQPGIRVHLPWYRGEDGQDGKSNQRWAIPTDFGLVRTLMVIGGVMLRKNFTSLGNIHWLLDLNALGFQGAKVTLDERPEVRAVRWTDVQDNAKIEQETHDCRGEFIGSG